MFSSHALTPRFWSQKRDKEKKSNEIFQGLGWIFRLARERDERAFETPETTGRSCESRTVGDKTSAKTTRASPGRVFSRREYLVWTCFALRAHEKKTPCRPARSPETPARRSPHRPRREGRGR